MPGIGVVTQEGILAIYGEGADTQHLLLLARTIGIHHRQLQALDTAAGGQVFEQQHPVTVEVVGGRQRTALSQRLEALQTLGVLGVEQTVLPLPGNITGALTHHAEQLTQVADTLRQQFFLLGQLGFLAVELGFQSLAFGLLGIQCGARGCQQLCLFAALGEKRLFALLHGADFGSALATDALQQLIRIEGFGHGGQGRQQAERQHGYNTTTHCAASSARVLIGRDSTAGACCWRAMAMAWVSGRRALPPSTSQALLCGFHQPLSWASRVW